MNISRIIAMGLSKAPKPFPGKYPTRVMLWNNRGPAFSYEGKPVPQLLSLVRHKFILKHRGLNELNFTEVDQNGVIRAFKGGLLDESVAFADMYHPVPRFILADVGRLDAYYTLLARRLVQENGKFLYENTFWENLPCATAFIHMRRECARNRMVTDACFSATNRQLALTALAQASDRFSKAPARTARQKRRAVGHRMEALPPAEPVVPTPLPRVAPLAEPAMPTIPTDLRRVDIDEQLRILREFVR